MGALDKYNIHLFVSCSNENFKSAISANAFSFYFIFCEQHHLQIVP